MDESDIIYVDSRNADHRTQQGGSPWRPSPPVRTMVAQPARFYTQPQMAPQVIYAQPPSAASNLLGRISGGQIVDLVAVHAPEVAQRQIGRFVVDRIIDHRARIGRRIVAPPRDVSVGAYQHQSPLVELRNRRGAHIENAERHAAFGRGHDERVARRGIPAEANEDEAAAETRSTSATWQRLDEPNRAPCCLLIRGFRVRPPGGPPVHPL